MSIQIPSLNYFRHSSAGDTKWEMGGGGRRLQLIAAGLLNPFCGHSTALGIMGEGEDVRYFLGSF